MRKSCRRLGAVVTLSLAALAAAGAAEFSKAFSRYPADGNPRALIAGRDGFLYGVTAEFTTGRGSGGGIFRVAPDDSFRMLHRFDITRFSSEPNAGGATPTELVVMARDGCLYGLTENGGLFGNGVLYRIRPDGDFMVICHLDRSQLTPDRIFSATSCSGFIEGVDGAFYTLQWSGVGPNILRIGRDGKMSHVGEVENAYRAYLDPERPHELVCVSNRVAPPAGPRAAPNQIKVTHFRVAGSQSSSTQVITSDVIEGSFKSPAVAWTNRGLLVAALVPNPAEPGERLYLLKPGGELELISDFAWRRDSNLPPVMDQFVHLADDGTLFYAVHEIDNKGGEGSTLLELSAAGDLRVVCGFPDGRMIHGFPAGAEDLCGASFSSKVLLPVGDDAAYSPGWLWDEARHVTVKHASKGGLFFQVSLTDSPVVNSRPIAVQDIVKTKPEKGFLIRNLKNDWDPEGGELRMNQSTEPERGFFTKTIYQCLYRSEDGGRSGGFVPYELLDAPGGRLSVGSILILGNPAGTYRDAARLIGNRPFVISVKKDGTFTAAVPGSDGKSVVMTGKIDWHNRGLAQAVLPSGESIAFSVLLVTDGPSDAALEYLIRSSVSGESTGQAVLGR
jgi:uncharacterized repeat protein (TIGR03803 family)